MADMDLVRELAAAGSHLAVIATTRADGTVHASLVKAGLLDDPSTGVASVGIVVAGSARKLIHLRKAGRATVVFKDGWRWAAVEGPAHLTGPGDPDDAITGPALPAVLRAIYAAAGGTHDDWEEFDRAMAEDRRCALFVEAQTITGSR
jgi:PPOX class probable F420-dependent enzyme